MTTEAKKLTLNVLSMICFLIFITLFIDIITDGYFMNENKELGIGMCIVSAIILFMIIAIKNAASIEIDEEQNLYLVKKNSSLWIIARERHRQVEEEQFSSERDDQYINGELADAAACYATDPNTRAFNFPLNENHRPSAWPKTWVKDWWKPSDHSTHEIEARKRELAKAGALILSEIDRLDRIKIRQDEYKREQERIKNEYKERYIKN